MERRINQNREDIMIIWFFPDMTNEDKNYMNQMKTLLPEETIISIENQRELEAKFQQKRGSQICLVTSGTHGQVLQQTSNLLTCPDIYKIYIFTRNIEKHKRWTQSIEKISIVSIIFDELLAKLLQDLDLLRTQPQPNIRVIVPTVIPNKKAKQIIYFFAKSRETELDNLKLNDRFPDEKIIWCYDINDVIDEIRQNSEKDLFLITSGSLGRELKNTRLQTDILLSPNIKAIYVYCGNIDNQKDWIEKFSKISKVSTIYGEIMEQISKDLNSI